MKISFRSVQPFAPPVASEDTIVQQYKHIERAMIVKRKRVGLAFQGLLTFDNVANGCVSLYIEDLSPFYPPFITWILIVSAFYG